jgi:predicted DNA-binding transcriptional regulator AlpA
MQKLIVLKDDLQDVVGFGSGTAARLERQGLFPRRREVSPGRVGWLAEELQTWARTRPLADGKMRGEATRRKREREVAT